MFKDYKNQFSLRSMLDAIVQWHNPSTFVLRLFFNEVVEHATRFVEVDFKDNGRRIAPYIYRHATGQSFDKISYEKFIYEPPYIKPRENITPEDLEKALAGESVYSPMSAAQRFAMLRTDVLKRLDDSITRREELQAIQALWDGTIPIVDSDGSTIGDSITFTRESELNFNAATVWSDATNCDPLADIRKSSDLIAKHTSLTANVAVHDTQSANEFIQSTKVLAILDNRRVDIGSIRMENINELESMGAKWIGQIEGIDHFRYDWYYADPATGALTKAVPTGKVLVGSTLAKSVRHYGSITSFGAAGIKARRYPKFYDDSDKDPESFGLQIHSAPLAVPHQNNAFSVITT